MIITTDRTKIDEAIQNTRLTLFLLIGNGDSKAEKAYESFQSRYPDDSDPYALYFPMFILGWMGMPRRYYDYLPQFHDLHLHSTIGSWILILGLLLMFHNLARSIRRGEKITADPWGGPTLEWSVSSPPPLENFEKIPHVDRGPYDFREDEAS